MYESSKDATLASKTAVDTDRNRITVAIKQYDGGEVKVSIDRAIKTKKGEWKWAKLRRLAADEVQPVSEALSWASTTLAELTEAA